ncbi:ADP-ribose pyrophosphatase [Sporosarcina sp. P37]|uniref:NUDIX hydrolase n=1 Tax=unclassified Sporosarcina TaxID=2647733 RepID=UPI0009BF6A6D|nr:MULTISPECIES: NUDIX hydrolase [unclassified Sporosarcina]ARD49407.1 ADP-ribose pyrophosphatase [Sporosarcina sp. P33]ARK25881.1 ADP-ribose pyrophosphatase [Sporosarcina sp. P37]PID18298.1 NUDIX hydrolase [Sporosarcina sp. P35]
MKFEERTLSTKQIFAGKIISLQVDEVELPDGKLAKRELVKHPGAVAIIALTEDKKIVLVEQFRKALERTMLEIPAGKIEPGEEPELTARRELEEETGYRAKSFKYLQTFSTSPGFADEIIHLYIAENLVRIEHPAAGDEDEFIEVLEVSVKEAEELIANERIYDAKTVAAVWYVKNL